MECDAIKGGDKEEGPVGTAFGNFGVAAVVDWKENMGDGGEAWENFAQGDGVRCLIQHKAHRWAQEDYAGVLILREVFTFEISMQKPG